jgi:hypothetical protein
MNLIFVGHEAVFRAGAPWSEPTVLVPDASCAELSLTTAAEPMQA